LLQKQNRKNKKKRNTEKKKKKKKLTNVSIEFLTTTFSNNALKGNLESA